MTFQTPFPDAPPQIAFDRSELSLILGLYGRMVAAGEWRDYGMSFLSEAAIFSIFRRTAEHPIYRIEKTPRLRARQGMYAVIGMDGRVLKRGHDLRTRAAGVRPQAHSRGRVTRRRRVTGLPSAAAIRATQARSPS